MTEWNSYKRVEAVFESDIPDRVPKFDMSIEIEELGALSNGQESPIALLIFPTPAVSIFHTFPGTLTIAKKFLKHPAFFRPAVGIAVKFYAANFLKYKYDIFSFVSGLPMIFADRLFRDFRVSEKGMVIRGPDGRLVWRTSLDGAHTRHGFMQDPSDWDKYMKLDPDHPGNYVMADAVIKTCKKLDLVPSFSMWGGAGFEDLCGIFGFEKTFKFLIKDKNFIKQVVKEMNEYCIAVAEKVLQRGGKIIYFNSDLGYKGRSLISPHMFREFFKPGMKKLCKRVHQLGGRTMFHSCGNVEKLMPDLVETGIDALHPIEKAAGNDIAEFRQKYGKDIIMVGNVPIPLLTHGTPRENYDYVLYLLDNVSRDGRHIIGSSHSLTKWCKAKNVLAYYKAVEDHGTYPIKIKL